MSTVDITWQAAYAAEYARTSGNVMTFGPALPGGLYLVSFSGRDAETQPIRMRKGEAIGNTERLRARESFA